MENEFLQTLMAVMSDQDDIAELPNNKLRTIEIRGGIPVDTRHLTMRDFRKIARLQTLAMIAIELSDPGEMDDIASVHELMGQGQTSVQHTMATALSLSEDYSDRVDMLKRLIVELVRQLIPSESEHLCVKYILHYNGNFVLMRFNNQNRAFGD